MVFNSFVVKQGRSGKAGKKRGEDSKSGCDLAQLGVGGRNPQNQPLMCLVSNLKFWEMSHWKELKGGKGSTRLQSATF